MPEKSDIAYSSYFASPAVPAEFSKTRGHSNDNELSQNSDRRCSDWDAKRSGSLGVSGRVDLLICELHNSTNHHPLT